MNSLSIFTLYTCMCNIYIYKLHCAFYCKIDKQLNIFPTFNSVYGKADIQNKSANSKVIFDNCLQTKLCTSVAIMDKIKFLFYKNSLA